MIKLIFLISILVSHNALAADANCKLSSQETSRLLKLDFQSFDQDLNGGWRALDNLGCHLQAANLLQEYRSSHLSDLEDWQIRTLTWHSGQIYAGEGLRFLTLTQFRQSYDPNEKADNDFNWNLYVDASIAFLQKDLVGLKKARDLMVERGSNERNLAIVEAFVRCHNKTYREAYNPDCR